MKIGYLGAGAWGSCLARLLAEKGFEVKQWIGTMPMDMVLRREEKLSYDYRIEENRIFTSDLKEAIIDIDIEVIEHATVIIVAVGETMNCTVVVIGVQGRADE